jgi:hypothetical protein
VICCRILGLKQQQQQQGALRSFSGRMDCHNSKRLRLIVC